MHKISMVLQIAVTFKLFATFGSYSAVSLTQSVLPFVGETIARMTKPAKIRIKIPMELTSNASLEYREITWLV